MNIKVSIYSKNLGIPASDPLALKVIGILSLGMKTKSCSFR